MNAYLIIISVLILIIIILIKLKTPSSKKEKDEKYGVESVTERGETVRSKKEKIVADYLKSKNIDYEYEKEIEVGDERMLTDFYLPNYDLYIEYWGLDKVQNKTGDEYRARKAHKIELYDKYNLKLISLNEDDMDDIGIIFPKKLDALINHQGSDKIGGLGKLLFGSGKKKTYHCTDCGGDLSFEGEYCSSCGNKENVFCDKCGASQPVGSEFCSSCGNPFK